MKPRSNEAFTSDPSRQRKNPRQDWLPPGVCHSDSQPIRNRRKGSETAGRFATASGSRSFAAVSLLVAEQLREQAGLLDATAAAVASGNFATTSRSGDFATASRFSDFATASRCTRIAAVVLGEQPRQQAFLVAQAAAVTSRSFATASRGFAAASRGSDFAAASGLDVATSVTALLAETIEQTRRSVRRADQGEGAGEHNRNEYTTHRGGLR